MFTRRSPLLYSGEEERSYVLPVASHAVMIACAAIAEDDAITLDTHELEDAIWVPRETVRAVLAGEADAPFLAPPPYAIAHTLLTAWADEVAS